ncbi:MAG TPA: carbohydrate ABC transporter permease [Lichenihabitans sp.]|jgi:trehalose/maltose transport system permease protein|nr:carbohydrate ABC transporter permease [Lichenihabitans sp.]
MTKLLQRAGLYGLAAIITVYSLFPFYYAIVSSTKTGSALFRADLLPRLNLGNYAAVLSQGVFLRNILNSVVVAVAVVAVSLFIGLTASYALGRVTFRGRKLLLLSILGISMFPQVAVLSGLFELIRALGLYDSLPGLMLAYLIFTLPFTVWVLTTFMRDLPKELEEAAIMDGATPWVIVRKVFMPLLWPALVTTGLLAFIGAWNEFLYALTFTLSPEKRTVPVAIALLSGSSQFELPWGPIMAASVVVTVPVVGLVLIFQRRIVSGLTAGAVKG